MSFEITRSSIDNIERSDKINLDTLLELLHAMCKDVLTYNGMNRFEDMEIGDVDNALVKELALLNILLPVYQNNKDEIAKRPSIIRQKHDNAGLAMQEAIVEISKIKGEVEQLRQAQEELSNKKEELTNRKVELEQECEKLGTMKRECELLRDRIKQSEEWIMNYSVEETMQQYNELVSEYTAMNNVISSVINDEFLREHLYKVPQASEMLIVENYPDLEVVRAELCNMEDVDNWFKQTGKRIKDLLDVFEHMVVEITKRGEEITAKKQQADSTGGKEDGNL